MSESLATIRTQDDLIEALRVAKALRGLSNDFCDQRAGLTRGHTDKVLGPTRAKSLSPMVFDLLMEIFAVELILVPNPEAEARMKPRWEERDGSNVRTGEHKVSRHVIARAKQHVLKDFAKAGGLASGSKRTGSHGTEIMRKAADALWKKRGRKRTRKAAKKRAWYRRSMEERLRERSANG